MPAVGTDADRPFVEVLAEHPPVLALLLRSPGCTIHFGSPLTAARMRSEYVTEIPCGEHQPRMS